MRVLCRPPAAGRLEARVVRSATGETLSGHDGADHATTVAGLSIVGATVTLYLSRALATSPVVSYGWSVDPAAAWLRDAAGAAVPCFDGVAVGP